MRMLGSVTFSLLLGAPLCCQAGTLDPTFGAGVGFVTTDFGSTPNGNVTDTVEQLLALADGRTYAVGSSSRGVSIARYRTDGTLDTAFGGDGTVFRGEIAQDVGGRDAALQPDGKIVVFATNYFVDLVDLSIYRFLADGTLDTTFSGDGAAGSAFGTGIHRGLSRASTILVQPDGKLVLVGTRVRDPNTSSERQQVALTRLMANGSTDLTFGTMGIVTYERNDRQYTVTDAVLMTNGRIVVAGTADFGTAASPQRHATLLRFDANGVLDGSFGPGGSLTTTFGATQAATNSIALLPDGKFLVAGYGEWSGTKSPVLARFGTNGATDATFGFQGSYAYGVVGSFADAAIAGDGTIVGLIDAGPASPSFGVLSANPGALEDRTFGNSGYSWLQVGTIRDVATAIAVLPSGNIGVAGYTTSGTQTDYLVARYRFRSGSATSGVRDIAWYDGGIGTVAGMNSGLAYRSISGTAPCGGGNAVRICSDATFVRRLVPNAGGVYAAFEDGKVNFSPNGHHLRGGGMTFQVYGGNQLVRAMLPYRGGMLTAFSGGGIYWSPDGLILTGGPAGARVYLGSTVRQMVAYGTGVMTVLDNGQIWFTPDATRGITHTLAYGGPVLANWLQPSGTAIYAAFADRTCWRSPDGLNLRGGGMTVSVLAAPAGVRRMQRYGGGVITAFDDGRITFAVNGNLDPASAQLVGQDPSLVTNMFLHANGIGVFTVLGNRVYYSPNGIDLTGGGLTQRVYPL